MNNYQKRKLRNLFIYLKRNNTFYSNIFNYYGISEFEEIENEYLKLPFIEKEDIRKNLDIYYSQSDEQVIVEYTSGSYGIPLKCAKTVSERSHAAINVWNKRRKLDSLVNISNYYNFFGHPDSEGDFTDLNTKELCQYFLKIMENKPRWIAGPISTIYELARLINRKVIPNPDIKYIELFGEYSPLEQRKYIEDAFKCRTVVHYGTKENWCIAYECRCGKLHIQENLFWLEISHNNIKFDDGSGEIIITSLYQKYMPFVKYNTKDIGRISNEECECGDKSRILELSGGRTAEIIKGKKLLGNNVFNRIVNTLQKQEMDCIERFKVIQQKIDVFDFYIIPSPNYNKKIENELINLVKQKLGDETIVNIKLVDKISSLPNGKYKNFECRVIG